MHEHVSDAQALDFAHRRLNPQQVHEVTSHADACSECRERLLRVAKGLTQRDTPEQHAPALAPAETQTLPRGTEVGRYMVLSVLGEGGEGVVYEAYDPQLDRRIALKLLKDAGRGAALLREARAMASLRHPSILAVHDAGRAGSQVFVALDRVEGQTLRTWLRSPRTLAQILYVFGLAGRGLGFAHRAGLVHRDFKPENVLIDASGAPRVTDFGVAVHDGEQAGSSGTPGYMAPEQKKGGVVDARADQFAFCATLHEALFGRLPEPGEVVPRRAGVPACVSLGLTRGLKREPAERFPNMRALLTALDPAPRARRVRVAAALAAATVLVAVSAWQWVNNGRARCSGSDALLAEVWNPQLRAQLQSLETLQRLLPLLDTYAVRWVEMRKDACEATRVRGEQSEALLDLRMQCFDARRRELGAIAKMLASFDASKLQRAVETVAALPRLERCSDAAELVTFEALPADPAARARIAHVREGLAQARAMSDLGDSAGGEKLSARLLDEARAVGHLPLLAEAWFRLGQIKIRTADTKGAEAALLEAIVAAETCRHDRIAANAYVKLTFLVGYRSTRYELAHQYDRHAEAAIARLGGDDELTADRLHSRSVTEQHETRPAEALRDSQEAARLLSRGGADSAQLLVVLTSMANCLTDVGRYEEAAKLHLDVLQRRERLLPSGHPHIAMSHNNLGWVYFKLRRPEEAVGHAQLALGLFERQHGPQHPDVALALGNVARAHQQLGDLDLARAEFQRAIAIDEKAFGPVHVEVAELRGDFAELLEARGEKALALAEATASAELWDKSNAKDEQELARARARVLRLKDALSASR